MVDSISNSLEYYAIKDYYGDNCTERSGVPYMNHINEGLVILSNLNATNYSKRAYCIHPLFQSDEILKERYNTPFINALNPYVLTLVMEYRYIANSYTSTDSFEIEDIKISPLEEVNHMLIADKIQNRKDFELYHNNKHIRSKELEIYFKNWLSRLNVSEKFYQEQKNILCTR